MTGGRARNRMAWATVLGLALVTRVGLVMATRPARLGADPADYDRLARLLAGGHGWGHSELAAGGGPTAFRAPLYPLFLAAVYKVTNDSVTAARLAQALLG